MNEQYNKFKEAGLTGSDIQLAWDSPFKVNIHSQQSIGTASVFLQYVYFLMDMSETFNIISGVTGGPAGTVSMTINPKFPKAEHADKVQQGEVENLHELGELDYLDLDVHIEDCQKLPPNFSSDVVIKFEFPPHIHFCVLPPGMEPGDPMDEKQKKKLLRRGGKLETTVLPENVDHLNPNPRIDYHVTIRLFKLDFRNREWFKNACLLLEVFGEPPDLKLKEAKTSNAPISRTKTKTVDKAALSAATPELKQEIKALEASLAAQAEAVSEAERRAKKAEMRENERNEEVRKLKELLSKDSTEQVKQLQQELAAAREEARVNKEAANKKSSSCTVS